MATISSLPPPPVSVPPPSVSVDDFERLGIAGQEMRPDVIRHAVRSAAAPLVKKTLKGYNAHSERELARVLSSGYRAIEPRLRARLLERVGLSLSDPNPPLVQPAPWALREEKEGKRVRDRFDVHGVLPRLEKLPRFAMTQRGRRESLMPLVLRGKVFVKAFWERRSKTQRWMLSGAFGLVAIIGLFSLGRIAGVGVSRKAVAEPASSPLDNNEPSALLNQTPAELSKENNPPSVVDEEMPATNAVIKPAIEPTVASPATTPKEAEQPRVTPTEDIPPAPALPVADPIIPLPLPLPMPVSETSMQSGNDVKPTEQPKKSENNAEVKPEDAKPDVPKPAAAEAKETAGPTLPDKADIDKAREKLTELEKNGPANERGQRLQRLYDLAPPASADRYVILEAMLDWTIFDQGGTQTTQLIEQLRQEFGVEAVTAAVSCALRCCEHAKSTVEIDRAVQWGLRATDMAIRHESFDAANDAIRATSGLATKGSSNEARLRVRTLRDGVSAAKRAQVSIPENDQVELEGGTSANQVGKYLCLHLCDWQRGLSWLARCNDVKLARAAKADLDGDWNSAAEQYLDLAKSHKGRTGDALHLRALELVRVAAEQAQGLEAETLRGRVKAIESEMPLDLRPLVALSAAPAAAPVVAIAPNRATMLGRIRGDGRDLNVLLKYKAGLEFNQQLLDQVYDFFKMQPVRELEFEFVGQINVPQGTTVKIKTAGPQPPDGRVAVTIDDVPVVVAPEGNYLAKQLDLRPGQHRVVWRIYSKRVGPMSFQIEDLSTRSEVTLFHNENLETMVNSRGRPLLNVSIVGR